jgi:hypothetical protein
MVECEMPTPTVTKHARRSNWTYADYCKIPPDRHRHEIIDGRHYVTPSPEIGPQRAGSRLVHQLMAQIESGALLKLARSKRRPRLYDLAYSALTVDLLPERRA